MDQTPTVDIQSRSTTVHQNAYAIVRHDVHIRHQLNTDGIRRRQIKNPTQTAQLSPVPSDLTREIDPAKSLAKINLVTKWHAASRPPISLPHAIGERGATDWCGGRARGRGAAAKSGGAATKCASGRRVTVPPRRPTPNWRPAGSAVINRLHDGRTGLYSI